MGSPVHSPSSTGPGDDDETSPENTLASSDDETQPEEGLGDILSGRFSDVVVDSVEAVRDEREP